MLLDEAIGSLLALPGTYEADHHGRRSFRVGKAAVVATVPEGGVPNIVVDDDLARSAAAEAGLLEELLEAARRRRTRRPPPAALTTPPDRTTRPPRA